MAKFQNLFSLNNILGVFFFNLKNPNKFFRYFVANLNICKKELLLQEGMRQLSIFVKELYDYILDTGYTGLQCAGGL